MPKNYVVSSVNTDVYFSKHAQPNLKTYFGRVEKGQPNIYTTPFAKGESTKDLLNSWDRVLVSISDKWPSLYEFEMDLAAKVGPMSVMKPLSERFEDIVSYYDGILLPSRPINRSAILATINEWTPARGLWCRSVQKTLERMKLSTNSGSPYFTKRRNVVDSASAFAKLSNGMSLTDSYINTAILGWRGQEGGYSKEDVKQRVVWMFPFTVNVQELRVYQPLIEAAQKFNIVPAWLSMEAVDRRVTNLFDTKNRDDLVICTDFTKFDQHFNPHLAGAAKTIIQAVFNKSIDWWLDEVYDIKYMIPIMYKYGCILMGRHGMGSGSGGTNADETLAHRALQYEAAIRKRRRLNQNSMCLGDDGIITYPGCTVEDVVESYSRHGLEMNTSKQYASTQDCVYLRRWHHQDYRIDGICAGVYSTMRALGRLRYLERYQDPEWWSPKAVALRQLSILENVKYHPLRDQFAEFCMKRDKYRLGIDIPGFLDNLENEVREAIDHMPDFLGYTKTLQSEGDPTYGISSWWIVKYLKSKA